MSERVDAVAKEEEIEENHLDSAEAPYSDPDAMTPSEAENLVAEAEARSPEVIETEPEESVLVDPESAIIAETPPGAEIEAAAADIEPEAANEPEADIEPEAAIEPEAVTELEASIEPEANAETPVTTETSETSSESPTAESDSSSSESAESAESTDSQESEDEKKVVRTLAVGQKVGGTVKRIADFGAFVDIGVGRDGLIHISELSIRRVGKVTDVLQEGQQIDAWIKKLDRDRNRISLTLIDPDTKTIRDLQKGDIVNGRVTRLLPYGAFVDIGIGRDALLHVREMAEGFVAKPEDVVKVDEELEARVIDLSRRRSRVDLSLKGLRPEPEAAVPHQSDSREREAEVAEEVVDDAFEDVEVLSAMELAFKRAMEAEGIEMPEKKGKRGRRGSGREIQDEIITRTLTDSGR